MEEMKAKLTIMLLEEAAKRASEYNCEVRYLFDDFTNVMEYEE